MIIVYTTPDFWLWRRWVKEDSFFFAFTSMWLTVFSWLLFPSESRSSWHLFNLRTWVTNSSCFSTTRHYKNQLVLTSLWMITRITFAAGPKWQCKIWELLKKTEWFFHASLHDHQPWLLRAFLPASAALANHSLDVNGIKWYKEPIENYLLYI